MLYLWCLSFIRGDFKSVVNSDVLQCLEHVATSPAFKPWEVMDSVPPLKFDLALFEQNTQSGM